MAIINGTVWLLALGAARRCQTRLKAASPSTWRSIDITTKDSSGYRELLQGLRSGVISVSGLVDDEAQRWRGWTLFTALNAQTVQALYSVWTAQMTTTTPATASALRLEVSAGTEDNVTYQRYV